MLLQIDHKERTKSDQSKRYAVNNSGVVYGTYGKHPHIQATLTGRQKQRRYTFKHTHGEVAEALSTEMTRAVNGERIGRRTRYTHRDDTIQRRPETKCEPKAVRGEATRGTADRHARMHTYKHTHTHIPVAGTERRMKRMSLLCSVFFTVSGVCIVGLSMVGNVPYPPKSQSGISLSTEPTILLVVYVPTETAEDK